MKYLVAFLTAIALVGCVAGPPASEPFPTGSPTSEVPVGWPDFCERNPSQC